MPSARPHLASWERRTLAGAIDALVLFMAIAVLLGATEAVGGSGMMVAAALPVTYLAYHSMSLRTPKISVGRTIMGLSVVSIRGTGEVSRAQALLRPAVRLAMLIATVFVSIIADHSWILVVPAVAELALVAFTPWRQSLADLLTGTLVVNSPEPQPHRAPAVPMFSATDEEFGPRP